MGLSLRDISARAIVNHKLKYVDEVPREMMELIWSKVYSSNPTLIHTPTLGDNVAGIACLGDELFIVRRGMSELEVFDLDTFTWKRHIRVPELKGSTDIVSDKRNTVIYIADFSGCAVFRVELNGDITNWSVVNPNTLSIANNGNVIVSSASSTRVKEYTPEGILIRVISLSKDIETPLHVLQLPSGQFILNDVGSKHGVSIIDEAGHTRQPYGRELGWKEGKLKSPRYLAVDDQGLIFVADNGNHRVVLLNPCRGYIGELVCGDNRLVGPHRLCLDETRGLLFVGQYSSDRQLLVYKIKAS